MVFLRRVNFTHRRVFFQTPLDQHLALNTTPELQRVDLDFRVTLRCADRLPFRAGLGAVDVQPVTQTLPTVLVEHCLDRPGVVPIHTVQLVQRLTAQAVALDQEPVVRLGRVCCRVQVKRVDAVPRRDHFLGYHRLKRTVGVRLPDQLRLLPHHRPLDNRCRERHQIVDKVRKRFTEPTFDQLVLHLVFHALGGFLSHFAGLYQRLGLHLLNQLVGFLTGQGKPTHLLDLHRLLVRFLENLHLHPRLDVWQRCRLDAPRLLVLGPHEGVPQPR